MQADKQTDYERLPKVLHPEKNQPQIQTQMAHILSPQIKHTDPLSNNSSSKVKLQQLSKHSQQHQLLQAQPPEQLIPNEIGNKGCEEIDFEDVEENYKMILLVRMDVISSLAQKLVHIADATLQAFLQLAARIDTDQISQIVYYEWQQSGGKKITVKVQNEAELLKLVEQAQTKGINTYVSKTKNMANIADGSVFVGALGPASQQQLDKLTKHLKLL